jgi:opacity protein-like surface antigen
MKKFSVAAFALLLGSSFASAADMPVPYAPVLWSWTGLYIGAHVGGSFTSSQFSDPAGASIFGGNVRSPAALAGFQLGYNWQIPNSNFLLGAEADASASIGDLPRASASQRQPDRPARLYHRSARAHADLCQGGRGLAAGADRYHDQLQRLQCGSPRDEF